MCVYKSADTYDSDRHSTMGDLKNRRAVIFHVSTQSHIMGHGLYVCDFPHSLGGKGVAGEANT